MSQPDLFTTRPRFDSGVELTDADQVRLTGQIERVYLLMQDGEWWTVESIAHWTGDPQPSVSAQIRNLRKVRFGGHTIERRRVDNHYEFRLEPTHV